MHVVSIQLLIYFYIMKNVVIPEQLTVWQWQCFDNYSNTKVKNVEETLRKNYIVRIKV